MQQPLLYLIFTCRGRCLGQLRGACCGWFAAQLGGGIVQKWRLAKIYATPTVSRIFAKIRASPVEIASCKSGAQQAA